VYGVPYQREANSGFDRYADGQSVVRRYYGKIGKARLDINVTDHAGAKMHPIALHAHTWSYSEQEEGKV
jgi:hypothetical protein